MNFLTLCRKLKDFFLKMLSEIFFPLVFRRKKPTISLLIPFSSTDPLRRRNFEWLLQYWKHELPEAEVIIGKSKSKVFCKGEALNHAAKKSRGKILVILDADAYINGSVLRECANNILSSIEDGYPLWYVPYRNLYRLKEGITDKIILSFPEDPLRLSSPPDLDLVEDRGVKSKYGNRYGAMCMMFPREAYNIIGNFDERFKGWGGEDVALLRTLDTVYGKHKTIDRDILHLWHPIIGDTYDTRMWEGQTSGSINWPLAKRYNRAIRNPSYMWELIKESNKYFKNNRK